MAVCMKYGKIALPNVPHREPVFIMRAQDIFAEKYVKMYAEEVLQRTGDIANYKKILLSAQTFNYGQQRKFQIRKVGKHA